MNKLSYLMMGFAALSFAACSSDEPTPAPTPDNGDGSTMYLNVRIKSADMGSRANSDKPEFGYDWGVKNEHYVSTADFFFFDDAKVYVAQAQVWDDGSENKDHENVEYISNNVLVLKGLTKKQTPKYMVTVLNAPEDLTSKLLANVTTLDAFRKEVSNYTEISTTIDGEKNDLFVMSTSSYYDATTGFEPGATILTADNLSVQKPDANGKVDPSKLTPVDVYVERLAAKYTMNTGNTNKHKVQITVSGFGNAPETGNEAYEEVYLTISGFGVTNIADNSLLLKNIEGFNATTPWNDWQKPDYFRSFWAKSLYYDYEDATGLLGTKVAETLLKRCKQGHIFKRKHQALHRSSGH